ncbi:MAG: MBL fold metallo-hydrolase [Eubacterium sp.]|nr:MBL fold metallo-hydrolase [Eubacterium sp.]
MAKICQLFSGSSGNSIFISEGETKLLVDAGVSAKRIENALSQIGEDASKLSGIFITHEHADHINGLRVLAARHRIPVFTSDKIIGKLFSEGKINSDVHTETAEKGAELGGIEIIPFMNSHDSVECYGYRFNLNSGRSVSVCTDTGYVTSDAIRTVTGSDLVYLESNHEVMMVENGPYHYMLKQRILSRVGHLSNVDSAEFSKHLVKNGTTRIVLAHLSRENNHPDIARQATVTALLGEGFEEGRDYRLAVSPPENNSHPIIL